MAATRVRKAGTAALVLAAAGPLAGCTTTRHEAQRMQLNSARERAAQLPTRVTAANPSVRASVVATPASGRKTAFVVRVSDIGRHPITDLPISVGYSIAGAPRTYLNASAGLAYFEAHLPAIYPGRPRLWVYTAARALPHGARAFALVGRRPSAPARLTEHVTLDLSYGRTAAGPLDVWLDNRTSVPQYQLQVYALARRDGRYVAAANATVTDLGAGSRQKLTLPLVGDAQGAEVRVEAIPTILQ